MKRKDIIEIHMLGEFTITYNNIKFPKDRKKSKQVMQLIAYLLCFRNGMIAKTELMEILWPNQELDNPEGALRNLIYRARKELTFLSKEEGEALSLILSRSNSYAWNAEIVCDIDIDRMKELLENIDKERDVDLLFHYCKLVFDTYGEDFLSEFSDKEWVRQSQHTIQSRLLKTVNQACRLFMESKKYEYIIDLCSYIDFRAFTDSNVHEYKLIAYSKLQQIPQAISYYHRVVDLYYSQMGIKISANIEKQYKKLLESSVKMPSDVTELEKELNEESISEGTFYCDFDVFKKFYQIYARAARRTTKARFLVLLTLHDDSGELSVQSMINEAEILRAVILRSLRKNDVFSKCNAMQYSLIVATLKMEGCCKAMERILQRYEAKKKEACVHLDFDIKNFV